MPLTFGVRPAVQALRWEVAFICGLDFPMPKIFALLEAAGRALERGAAAVQAVVARALGCDSSRLGQCV